ncbi:Ref family recombination enhancement nuclease [Bordetella sp. 15P40C-2]|uniref:Ref family recombination enhancement nuclease n=1 Tax=Bordetella sp. 15P40C-2 TaxID=2572246 RepID=UPI00132847F1|nr:Ref family recombination enhancement nuclease [Bordetella sp. 15P40C-2]MVW72152.1 recombinase [Bordetella sp. 15P40C-2]
MKGISPTAEQRQFHDLLCAVVGCVACRLHGVINTHVSVHHIDGRTKKLAHWLVLPLCAGHHQEGTGAPGMIAVHPWKARFEQKYGKQLDLLRRCVRFLLAKRCEVPAAALEACRYDTALGAQPC